MNDRRDNELFEWRMAQVEEAVKILADGQGEIAGSIREIVTTIKMCGAGIGLLIAGVGIVVSVIHI